MSKSHVTNATILKPKRPWLVIIERLDGSVDIETALTAFDARRIVGERSSKNGCPVDAYPTNRWDAARELLIKAWTMFAASEDELEDDVEPAPKTGKRK